jgi:hypothetical protein
MVLFYQFVAFLGIIVTSSASPLHQLTGAQGQPQAQEQTFPAAVGPPTVKGIANDPTVHGDDAAYTRIRRQVLRGGAKDRQWINNKNGVAVGTELGGILLNSVKLGDASLSTAVGAGRVRMGGVVDTIKRARLRAGRVRMGVVDTIKRARQRAKSIAAAVKYGRKSSTTASSGTPNSKVSTKQQKGSLKLAAMIMAANNTRTAVTVGRDIATLAKKNMTSEGKPNALTAAITAMNMVKTAMTKGKALQLHRN